MVDLVSLVMIGLGLVVFGLLFYTQAPYGKFHRKGWGPELKAGWAWMLMEMPSPLLILFFFVTSADKSLVKWIFVILWLLHYLYRSFIYPFLKGGRSKPYPVSVAGMAFLFNCANGFINGYGIFHLMEYGDNWLWSFQFTGGLAIFVLGFYINKRADLEFIKIKGRSKAGYVIPRGWLFEYISSPHYFGEIIQWSGWALMTFSLPGLAFAVFTVGNLFPRAMASHNWYRRNFSDYPSERKAVIPFII